MSLPVPTLADHNQQTEESILSGFPQVEEWLSQQDTTLRAVVMSEPLVAPASTTQAVLQTISETGASHLATLTQEELSDIIQKLKELATLPNAPMDASTQLYLEQQVTDLLGFSVCSRQDEQVLPLHSGVCAALIDPPVSHPALPKWYVQLPLHLLSKWREEPLKLKTWFTKQKIVLLNPFDGLACVAECALVGPDYSVEYQLGASQAVIQATQLWSYNAQGHCLLFFVEEPELVQTGSYKLPPLEVAEM